MSETSFKIKCSKSASARRFSLSKPTLADLRSHVEASWGASGPSFWYVDDDGDRIAVENDQDLDAAIAAKRGAPANLNVDFDPGAVLDGRDGALPSPVSSSHKSSDDEDGFITVELHSEPETAPLSVSTGAEETLEPKEQIPAKSDRVVVASHQPQPQKLCEKDVIATPSEHVVSPVSPQPPRPVTPDRSPGGSAELRTVLELKREVQTLRDALDSARDQAAINAERARQIQKCTVIEANERFEATTSVLKIQLREAKAALAAAQQHAPKAEPLLEPCAEDTALRSLCGDLLTRLDAALNEAEEHKQQLENAQRKNENLVAVNADLEQFFREEVERMRVQVQHAEADVARANAEAAHLEAAKRQDAAAAERALEDVEEELVKVSSQLHDVQELQDQNRRLSDALAAAEQQLTLERAQNAHQAAASRQRAVPVPLPAARTPAPVTQPQTAPSAATAPPAFHHAQCQWVRVAQTVGCPQPSSADIEKFERCLSVLRSMSLDAGDDAVRCVVVNDGNVQTVVDQMLAALA